MSQQAPSLRTTRRDFLRSTTALTGAALASAWAPAGVHAAGSDIIRVGLIGCGGRGTGAAVQALHADPGVRLVAMGDMFADRLESSLRTLRNEDESIARRVEVTPDRCFTGFDAYKHVIASGVDVVLLATPPHFRPAHIKAAVAAGKHIFAEKPCAVDAPGVRSVLASVAEAKAKGLSIVAGLCWRYHTGMRETFRRIHDGAIGDIVALQCTYNTHGLWSKERQPGWSDMEWQLRNWLYFTWLSGDFNVEQHVHSLDKMAWAMQDQYPVKAVGVGGRQVRTDPRYGHIFDHHAVVYEYANGVKCFSCCRQQNGCAIDVSDHVMGTRGVCEVMKHKISGERPWQYPAAKSRGDNMYQNEQNELFASIRSNKPINNGEWMAKSTLMAIMGRMATYTGQVITWEMALNSKEDLTPPKYEFGPLPVPPVAMPGITKFV
ncbi:MAG: Gfo/Idh/MocA family oxidoreductase [Gemmataceae bacterium]|nr:Gfo/Idh/MocA family oxidoreductase [Gemmataceae bacterium]MDW8264280.1 Gfo/Idh/MocA family oxidoreductase [Gemmataceae bacterium]